MDIIDTVEKKIKFNPNTIHRLLSRQIGQHINGLSEPCYQIKTKNFQHIFYKEIGITEAEMKKFAEEIVKQVNPKLSAKYRVPFTIGLSYVYYRFARAGKKNMARDVLLYLLIKLYGSKFEKHLPAGCHDETFRYTIENLVATHLFYKYKTIANAVVYLSNHIHGKFFQKMKTPKVVPLNIIAFTQDSVNRVNQSSRSFFQAYYRNRVAGKGITINVEPSGDDENRNMYQTTTGADKTTAAVEKFLKNIFVYKNRDKRAIDEAKRISRVKNNLAETVIPLVSDKSSEEKIKIILTSFMREILDVRSLCGPPFFKIVKSLMMKRDYKDKFIFRSLVVEFTTSIFERANPPTYNISHRDKISLDLFVALYITISFRNLFC